MRRLCAIVAILLSSAGCASTFQMDKDTTVIFTFGLGFAVVRENEMAAESTPVEGDDVEEENADGP